MSRTATSPIILPPRAIPYSPHHLTRPHTSAAPHQKNPALEHTAWGIAPGQRYPFLHAPSFIHGLTAEPLPSMSSRRCLQDVTVAYARVGRAVRKTKIAKHRQPPVHSNLRRAPAAEYLLLANRRWLSVTAVG